MTKMSSVLNGWFHDLSRRALVKEVNPFDQQNSNWQIHAAVVDPKDIMEIHRAQRPDKPSFAKTLSKAGVFGHTNQPVKPATPAATEADEINKDQVKPEGPK